MKVKLRTIIDSSNAISSLTDQPSSLISAGTRFILSEDFDKIKDKITRIGNEQKKLIEKYKIGPQTLIASPEYQSYQLELDDILDTEMELETEPFLTKVIFTDDRCTLTSKEMSLLKFLRVDESKKEENNDKKE